MGKSRSSGLRRYWSDIVPRDVEANAAYRIDVLREAQEYRSFRTECREACKEDLLFFVNTFLWTFSPKDHPEHPVVPFVTWPFQDRALRRLQRAMGAHDLLIEKSRDMGASWMCLVAFLWKWQFYEGQTFLLVSRVEDLVDKRNEPDCLMWKLDFALKQMPDWLRPAFHRQKLSLYNKDLDSAITGASTTAETSRGGRKQAILFDEFAAVDDGYSMNAASRDTTKCRIFNSTPQGTGNAFADLAERLPPERKLTLHWKEHPLKRKGLYTSVDGQLEILLHHKGAKADYPYILDGKIRSPWYDNECRRAASEQEIAQELDIDYAKSGWQFFDPEMIATLTSKCRVPMYVGELEGNEKQPRFREVEGGDLRLWVPLEADGKFTADACTLGVDVATGKGGRYSSQSAISVFRVRDGAKIAEFTNRHMAPDVLADTAMQLGYFFGDGHAPALLVWEANGPGAQFSKQVVNRRYPKIFWRESGLAKSVAPRARRTEPGWWSNKDLKRRLLGEYGRALREEDFYNPSEPAIKELAQYSHQPNGEIIHGRAAGAYDPTERGENHGDLVIADALAWRGAEQTPQQKARQRIENMRYIPPNSMMARKMVVERRAAEAALGYWS